VNVIATGTGQALALGEAGDVDVLLVHAPYLEEAFVAAGQAPYASRGDDSGTHAKEVALWRQAGLSPAASDAWYAALGQGMGATLRYADEIGAYTLTDRGTFLAQQATLTQEFIDWLTSPQTRQAIGEYGRDRFGQSLFIPAPWLEEKD
jgi:tungstate transport system substrate-binding protein